MYSAAKRTVPPGMQTRGKLRFLASLSCVGFGPIVVGASGAGRVAAAAVAAVAGADA